MPHARQAPKWILAAASVVLMLACCNTGGSRGSPKMTVSNDIGRLRKHIVVPKGVLRARWAARPRGSVGLGPTDLELLALFPMTPAEWTALSPALGPEGARASTGAPKELLEAVGLKSPSLPRGATLPCTPYANSRWTCHQAIRIKEGVLVYLTSQ